MSTAAITEEQAVDAVRAALVRILAIDPAPLSRDTRFREDLHTDSLALVELVEVLEQQFPGLHVPDEDIDGFTTLGTTADYLVARRVEPR